VLLLNPFVINHLEDSGIILVIKNKKAKLIPYNILYHRLIAGFLIRVGINLAFLFFITRMIPESSRWLISQGKYDDAENIIQRIAKVNKKPFWKI
jgi:hypothetical protein